MCNFYVLMFMFFLPVPWPGQTNRSWRERLDSQALYHEQYSKKDENLEKKVGLFSLILYHGKYSILVKFQSCRERSKKKGWTFKPYHVIYSKTNNMSLRIKTQPDATVQYVSGFLITSIWPWNPTVRNVLADFAVCDWIRYCKALCDVEFSQIEWNSQKLVT